jgi:hypothetical protein
MKIRPAVLELLNAERRADRHDEIDRRPVEILRNDARKMIYPSSTGMSLEDTESTERRFATVMKHVAHSTKICKKD